MIHVIMVFYLPGLGSTDIEGQALFSDWFHAKWRVPREMMMQDGLFPQPDQVKKQIHCQSKIVLVVGEGQNMIISAPLHNEAGT